MSAFASVNVFSGIQKNFLFCSILVVTAILQVLIVQFGSKAFHVAQGGLGSREWMISIVCGVLSLPVQQLINVIYSTGGSAYKKTIIKILALKSLMPKPPGLTQ